MRVGIIQSNFIPWRGYFDFIDDCDLFIYHDDLQYTKNDWRNRNRIKTAEGPAWVTVPVHYRQVSQRICDTGIDYSKDWAGRIANQIRANYMRAPFFKDYSAPFFEILNSGIEVISDLNVAVNRWIAEALGIRTEIRMSKEFSPEGAKTDRLIGILKKAGATSYLSGPSAKAYIEPEKFSMAGISLEYKSYEYAEYPQLYHGFEPNVTVLDLLFNCGPDARGYLKSLKCNETAA